MAKAKKKMGRPEIEIDFDALDKLLGLQATLAECSYFFNCSEDTIERAVEKETGLKFNQYQKIKKQGGLISLRRSQWKLAEKNATMAIFLGKQYLGQRDIQEVNANVNQSVIPQLEDLTTEELKELLGEETDDSKANKRTKRTN